MTPERFRRIVAAYGADARRWPDGERAAADAWARAHRDEAAAALAGAAVLDAWLARDAVAPPAPALVEQIVATAPVRRLFWRRGRFWWSGAAFAGVGLAGAVAGAIAVSMLMLGSPPPHDATSMTTSFGGSGADWSGQ
ncbi:hypothetical protein [Burkholderia oklahomensis]|uniref:Uncharacterized protein n=1 Tax=Burkholderia oklahomensis TaxID=342113 RepID=A0AAI8BDM4_9BURK|nr:hypothetical protein [Burkholderia oklahomensis]AIO70316.1 hypothetical protein DM82_4971 [Burkholderia oklahomensis]AOI39580.1 hypothetical protein WG70_08010 [Burkholderia oklahomensis EO147]KUY51511.1 hypothetical protein WG70_16350 [Burkholderia oklahomensis EO147]QPS40068.1 hypothetical protein I6G57_30320 [Burkholderia oklahomensis]